MATAPFGARVAHTWPVRRLKRAFACMLCALGAHTLWEAYSLWRGMAR